MKKIMIITAGVMGFLAVAIGAFGAHVLESQLSPKVLDTFKTGVQYHLVHSAVLLALALTFKEKFKNSFRFFTAGIILFSFSLYFYSALGIKFFAMITPIGGFAFLIGWVLLIFEGLKYLKKST